MLLLSCLVAACGGGAPVEPMALESDTARRSALAAAPATPSTATTNTTALDWPLCAAEGQRCEFEGTRTVRYGSGAATVDRPFSGGVTCGNAAFGDPIMGVAKSCWLQPLPTGWTDCAAEGGTCQFSDLRQVRYGTATRFVTVERAGPVNCSNAVFTDPAVGEAKRCSYAAAASWVSCAIEGGQCSFTGTREVRYGTLTAYRTDRFSERVACDNSAFGDPAIGLAKACWVSATLIDVPVGGSCEALPALPALPANAKTVTTFCKNGRCARPDDGVDDTDAIELALSQSAGSFLVFPPGKYEFSRSLRVKQPGVTLWGPGATLHGTNWDDQALIIEANDVSVYSFRFTAVTGQRGSRAEHTRIAIYGPASVNPVVRNTVIRNNVVVNAGEPGTALANAATGAGIFVNAADGFLIAGNTVARTLADGIHLTGGARNGRVLDNTVRETGDDMIAVVSYAYPDPVTNTAATILSGFSTNIGTYQSRNILVSNNRLSGQYWGRGIAVVGGRDITIRGNTLSNLPYGAAVLLARETQSGTYGLRNVLVERNMITDVQNLAPPYDVGRKFASHGRTGHGAIELHSSIFLDELAVPALTEGFSITGIAIRDNTVQRSATPAVRIGVGTGNNWTFGPRPVSGNAPISGVAIERNALSAVASDVPVQMLGDPGVATCQANTQDGRTLNPARCASATASATVTGATLACRP